MGRCRSYMSRAKSPRCLRDRKRPIGVVLSVARAQPCGQGASKRIAFRRTMATDSLRLQLKRKNREPSNTSWCPRSLTGVRALEHAERSVWPECNPSSCSVVTLSRRTKPAGQEPDAHVVVTLVAVTLEQVASADVRQLLVAAPLGATGSVAAQGPAGDVAEGARCSVDDWSSPAAYGSRAYSARASLRTGMSGSAFFQSVKRSL